MELLAVIAILAILVILALPNVMNMYVRAKKNTFLTEAQNVLKESSNKFIQGGMNGKKISVVSNSKNSLNLTGEKLKYNVKLDNKGNVTDYVISNGNYCVTSKKSFDSLTIDDVKENCSYEELNNIVGTLINNFYEKSGNSDRTLVSSITFYSDGRTINAPNKYDVSKAQDNSIIMYVSQNSENSLLFDLTIVANGKIYLLESSSTFFSFHRYNSENHTVTTNLKKIIFNDSIDTSKVTNMSNMFFNDRLLSVLELSDFDTSNVTNMGGMFAGVKATSLDLSSFDTSSVTNMSYMFNNSRATSLDLSKFDTSKVTNMSWMFNNSLVKVLDLNSFDTSKVTDMSAMFRGIINMEIKGLEKFSTTNVTNMHGMFELGKIKTLDLSSFNTSSVNDMCNMFLNTPNLETLYASDKFVTNNVTSSTNMFSNSTNLVGGAGTTYNSSKTDKTYARIDEGTDNPGYFTKK